MKLGSLTWTFDSKDLVEKGKINFLPLISLGIKSDGRIDEIADLAKHKIKANNWATERDERKIAEEVIRLVQQERFYGLYNKDLEKHRTRVLKNADYIKYNPDSPRLETWKKEQAESKEFIAGHDRSQIGNGELSSYKSGSLCCREYTIATAAILHKLGIESNICAGVGYYELGDNMDTYHMFLQLKQGKKNIIETTSSPKGCFMENLNGADIAQGEIVEAKLGATKICYGGGKISPAEEAVLLFSGLNGKLGYHMAKSNYADCLKQGRKTDIQAAQEFMQAYAHEHANNRPQKFSLGEAKTLLGNYLIAMDIGSGPFKSGAYDGVISTGELKQMCRKMGAPAPHIGKDSKVIIESLNLEGLVKAIDKDKDGFLSRKEIAPLSDALGLSNMLLGKYDKLMRPQDLATKVDKANLAKN